MNAGFLVLSSWSALWLTNEIKKYISVDMFHSKLVSAIVNSIIMVIPHTNNVGAIGLHFIIVGIIVLGKSILTLNMIGRHVSFSIFHDDGCLLVNVSGISSPNPYIG
jgi:hypothetical protein